VIRLGSPDITSEDLDRVVSVLSSGSLVQGREVERFESELADMLGIDHVVAVSSGTTALEVSLKALGVGRGDAVITSSYSWIATANVIELVGAEPIFIDIEPTSFNIDVDKLETMIHRLRQTGDLRRVKAVIPVHAFGYTADIYAILELVSDAGCPVIEDAACALGAQLGGAYAGTIGQVGCFSFHPLKSITTGEGGAITTRDADLAQFARAYRNHGQAPGPDRNFVMFGTNYRMTDVMAALGSSQFERLPDLLKRRRWVIERYLELLDGEVGLPAYDPARHAAQSFVVRLPADADRSSVVADLRADGIEVGTGTVPIPFATAYARKYGYRPGDFPVLSEVARDALSLPLHTRLSDDDVEQVVSALLNAIGRNRGRAVDS
jgi:dTDP-4-amino-4,6-dideoxygalactose transaminase